MVVLSLIFWVLAAICNAYMDSITYHWYESKIHNFLIENYKGDQYRNLYNWFNPQVSWLNKYEDRNALKPIRKICFGLFDRPFTDAWHTLKSLMIVFICLSISCLFTLEGARFMVSIFDLLFCFNLPLFLSSLWVITMYGTIWNLTFNLFYNKWLKAK